MKKNWFFGCLWKSNHPLGVLLWGSDRCMLSRDCPCSWYFFSVQQCAPYPILLKGHLSKQWQEIKEWPQSPIDDRSVFMALAVYVLQLKIITSRTGVPNFHHHRGTFPAVQCHGCSRPLFSLDCAQKTCTAAQAGRAAQILSLPFPLGWGQQAGFFHIGM